MTINREVNMINSNAMMMPNIRIDPKMEYFVDEDNPEMTINNSTREMKDDNMIRDNDKSMENKGMMKRKSMNNNKREMKGMDNNNVITDDLGY